MVDTAGAREPQVSGTKSNAPPAMGGGRRGVRQFGPGVVLATTIRVLVSVVWAVVAIVNLVVMLDFVFRLIGAKDEGFAHAVLSFGMTVASPFDGIFASVGRLGGYNFRWSDLVVVFLCTVAGIIVTRVISLARGRRPSMA